MDRGHIVRLLRRKVIPRGIGTDKGIRRVYRVRELFFLQGKALAELRIDGHGNGLAVVADTDDFVEIEVGGSGEGNRFCRRVQLVFSRRNRNPVEIGALRLILFRIDIADRGLAHRNPGLGIQRIGTLDGDFGIRPELGVNVSDIDVNGRQLRLLVRHFEVKNGDVIVARDIGKRLARAAKGAERPKPRRKKQHEQDDKRHGEARKPPARFFSGISDMIHRAEKPPLFAFVPP